MLLDNPLAGVVANAIGADISKARRALHLLSGQRVHNGFTGLDTLRNGLKQLRG